MKKLGNYPGTVLALLVAAAAVGCAGSVPAPNRGTGLSSGEDPRAKWQITGGGKEDPNAAGRGGLSGPAVELGVAIREEVGRALGEEVESSVNWVELEEIGFSGRPDAQPLIIRFRKKDSEIVLVSYYLVPWQPMRRINSGKEEIAAYPELLTVAEPAMVFGPFDMFEKGERADELRRRIAVALSRVIDEEENERVRSDRLASPPPEGLQIISAGVRKYYVSVSVAIPGSKIPSDGELERAAPGKLIRIFFTPDMGPVEERWLVGQTARGDAGEIGSADRESGNEEPEVVVAGAPEQLTEGLFPDYQPKLTPDTPCDFRWSICEKIERLPPAEIDSLPALMNALEEYKQKSAANPGRFESGNMILGGDPNEYRPSDDEMMESEIGRRIGLVVEGNSRQKVKKALAGAGFKIKKIIYRAIWYRHSDVMGSGRFFYASEPEETEVELTGPGERGAGSK